MGFFDELRDEITDAFHPAADAPDAVAAWNEPVAPGTPIVHSSVTINGAPATAADLAPFETMANMDLNGDGVIGDPATGTATPGGAPASATPASSAPRVVAVSGADAARLIEQFAGAAGAASASAPADPVAQLERLAALHSSGALSDAEFDAAKRAVLGER